MNWTELAPGFVLIFLGVILMLLAVLGTGKKKSFKIPALDVTFAPPRKRGQKIMVGLIGLALFIVGLLLVNPFPLDNHSPTPTATAPAPTSSSTPSPTFTPAPSATSTPLPVSTATATLTATSTVTPLPPTLTPTPTSTPTPTATLLPSLTPTASSTPTVTPTSAPTKAWIIADCVNANSWYFWTRDVVVPRKPDKPDCYDLRAWGMEAQKRLPSSNQRGLRIKVSSTEKQTAGIYYFLPDEETIYLTVEIDKLVSNQTCQGSGVCDANLIFGFGNPSQTDQGWFVIFRVTGEGSDRLVCVVDSIYNYCSQLVSKESFSFESAQPHQLQFIANGLDYSMKVDNTPFPDLSMANKPRVFWVGYNLRSGGSIEAFVTFSDTAK
jgi:hypothetical protein